MMPLVDLPPRRGWVRKPGDDDAQRRGQRLRAFENRRQSPGGLLSRFDGSASAAAQAPRLGKKLR